MQARERNYRGKRYDVFERGGRDGNMVFDDSKPTTNRLASNVGLGTGFLRCTIGGLFSMDPSSPNALAGGAASAHDYSAFAQKVNAGAFGIMGGLEPVAGANAHSSRILWTSR